MSTIAQAVDGLLAGLLLPAARLLWIHGLFKMVVEGLAPVRRLPADCAAMDRGIESDAPDQSKLGLCGFRSLGTKGSIGKEAPCAAIERATKLPTIAETTERCVAGVCVAGKERKMPRARCDRRR